LPGAEDAFLVDGSAYELDPFRVAGPAAPRGEATTSRADPVRLGKPCSKLFVGGLPAELDDAALLKAFSRYGKVQEASVVRGEGGKSRGFGFVTYVHLKGASYCIQQLGNPPELTISGHTCRVRYSERRGDSQPQLNMPARGQYNPNPRRGAIEQKAPGAPGSARQLADGRADPDLLAGGEFDGGDGYGGGGAKKGKKRKQEIVTVSHRQDAEPLYDKKLSMKEMFSKELWRM